MATEVNELRIEAKTESLARAEADLNKVAAAQQRVATSGDAVAAVTDKVASRQVSAAAAYDKTLRKIDAVYAAEQNFLKQKQALDRALSQGLMGNEPSAATEKYNRELALAEAHLAKAKTANDNFSHSAAEGAKLTSYEMTNLGRQVNDVATMLASGSSPFQVIATQSGQVYDVLANSKAGLGGAVKQLGSGLLGLLTPARIAMGGIAAVGVTAALAYSSWRTSQAETAVALSGIGRASGATVQSVNEIALAAAAAGKATVGEARDMSNALLSTGKVGEDMTQKLVLIGRQYERTFGIDAATATAEFAAAFADPARGVDELNKRLGAFNAGTVETIRNLDAQNRTLDAQKLLYEGVKSSLAGGTQLTSGWARMWDVAAASASRYWAIAGRKIDIAIGTGGTQQDQLATAQARLNELLAIAARRSAAVNKNLGTTDLIVKARAEVERLTKEIADAAEKSAEVKTNLESLKLLGDVKFVMPEIDVKAVLEARARALGAAAEDPVLIKALGLSQADVSLAASRARAAADSFISETDRAVKSAQLAQQAITARSPTDKARIAERQKELELANSALSPEEKLVQTRLAYNTALAQSTFQLTEAQRQRVESAEQGAASQELEIQLIGKTAGEQALMRANFASWWALRQEAAQNGTAMNLAEYQQLVKINEVTAQRVQLAAQARLQDEIAFQRAQLGRSTTDQAIASQQRSMGLPVDLDSAEASAMRFTATLSDMKNTGDSALSGFIDDLRQGKTATEALRNAMNRLLDDLIKMASNQAVSGLMQGLMGITGTSSTGLSLGSSAPVMTSFGMTTGIFHSGGIIGADMPGARLDHPALYADAPRFHTGRDPFGLMAGEQRAIVKKDEGIFTPAQMRALGARSGGGDTISQVFAPVIHMGSAGQGSGGVSPEELMQTLQQWWKSQRADVVNVLRDARSRRVPGV